MQVKQLGSIIYYYYYYYSLLSIFPGSAGPKPFEDIQEPRHDRVFCEKFHSVNVVKGV